MSTLWVALRLAALAGCAHRPTSARTCAVVYSCTEIAVWPPHTPLEASQRRAVRNACCGRVASKRQVTALLPLGCVHT